MKSPFPVTCTHCHVTRDFTVLDRASDALDTGTGVLWEVRKCPCNPARPASFSRFTCARCDANLDGIEGHVCKAKPHGRVAMSLGDALDLVRLLNATERAKRAIGGRAVR